jgi:5-amino-6-(5-phosphoribosylamino)uracil reductase
MAQYPTHVEWVATGAGNPVPVILSTLQGKAIQTLMVEGGGHIMNLFLQAQAIQELYLTVCPLLLGGQQDPSLVTGSGFTVANAPRTKVRTSAWIDQELYLHLDVIYPH